MYTYTKMNMCMYICVSVYMCIYIYMHIITYVYVYGYMYIYIYIYIVFFVCLFVCFTFVCSVWMSRLVLLCFETRHFWHSISDRPACQKSSLQRCGRDALTILQWGIYVYIYITISTLFSICIYIYT